MNRWELEYSPVMNNILTLSIHESQPFNEKVTQNALPIGKWHTSGWNSIKIEFEDLKKYSQIVFQNKFGINLVESLRQI